MKKYVQVVLVVLSVFSLISLLVYRHEYNKLRYVLEVLNFFGTPGVGHSNSSCLNNLTYRHLALAQPSPSWQRVSNAIHVYSAYWDKLEGRPTVKAVAIGVLNENLNYGCYLWTDNHETPIKGDFSFSGIPRRNQKIPLKNSIGSKYFAKTSKNKGYLFYCSSHDLSTAPVGVSFYNTNNEEAAQAHIPVVKKGLRFTPNNSAICLMPRESPFAYTEDYLKFLSYHSVIGVQDFLVYGGEFIYEFLNRIQSDATVNNFSINSLQWNYPFLTDYDLMRSVAEADCMLRTKGYFANVVALAWNQYVVPKFHSSINNIIHDFDPDNKMGKFQLSTVLFCLEYNDDPKSSPQMPLIFRKSRYALPRSNITVVVNRVNSENTKVQKISREIAAVHWYTKCDLFDLKVVDKTEPKYDHSILRFKTELIKSSLLTPRIVL